jgi:hypothetical protein
MLRMIERNIEALEDEMVLLAPRQAAVPAGFGRVEFDPGQHERLLGQMQALRGSVYLREGNVTPACLTNDGRHQTPEDDRSWHLLMTDAHGHITSCVLYFEHDPTVTLDDLRVRHCPLVYDASWQALLHAAVASEIRKARKAGLAYAEVGGLAIEPERRGSTDSLMLTLGTYALARLRGGALGITTANVAYSCSSILRRLGGAALEHDGVQIPPYFDPRYNTDIELLRFDSRNPTTKYAALIDRVKEKLSAVRVVSAAFEQRVPVRYAPVAALRPVYAA